MLSFFYVFKIDVRVASLVYKSVTRIIKIKYIHVYMCITQSKRVCVIKVQLINLIINYMCYIFLK